jgi:hypothetical protein
MPKIIADQFAETLTAAGAALDLAEIYSWR